MCAVKTSESQVENKFTIGVKGRGKDLVVRTVHELQPVGRPQRQQMLTMLGPSRRLGNADILLDSFLSTFSVAFIRLN